MPDQDEIFIPDDMNTRVEWALGDVTAAMQDFSTAYNICGSIIENVESYKEDLDSLGDSSVSDSFGNLSTIATKLNEFNETDFETMGGLGTYYSMCADTVLTMLGMIDQLEGDARKKALDDLKNGQSIDYLFDHPSEELLQVLAKNGFTAAAKGGAKYVFSQIFESSYGNALIGNGVGFVLDFVYDGKITLEDLAIFGVNLGKDTATVLASIDGSTKNTLLKKIAEGLGKHGQGIMNAGSGFLLAFTANVVIHAIQEGKDFGFDDVGDSAVEAGIGVVSNAASKALVTALCEAIGISTTGGPAMVGIAVVGSLLTYGGVKLYEYIKHCVSTNGDGIPKKYEHMTNEELLELMHQNGYSFGLPTYEGCSGSAFDLANTLSRYGASEELITFVEAGAGANVPVDCLYQDVKNGVVDAKTQAIIDYFFNSNFVTSDNTDEYFRHYGLNPDQIYDGYADEYNEQVKELQAIFGLGGASSQNADLDALNDYLIDDFAYGKNDGSVAEKIEGTRSAQNDEP